MVETAVRKISRNRTRWLDRQQQALFAISRMWREDAGDLRRTIRRVTETTSHALDVDRVSVWRCRQFGRSIVCEDLYEAPADRHSKGIALSAARYPAYFAAMRTGEVIAASDAMTDPRTSEFAEEYLGPLGIGAMLDTPVLVGGRVGGVLCLEHVGGPRTFRDDEMCMAAYLADMIGAIYEIGGQGKKRSKYSHAFRQLLAAGEKLEELIRDEMAVWRILFEQSRDGIVVLDRDASVVAANQKYADLLGYSQDELDELSVWDWDRTFEKSEILEMLRRVDESGDHFETRHRCKDGTIIDVEVSTNGAVFKHRKLIFCIVRDVTERKRMEEQLRILATIDGLTGVANRKEFMRRLEGEIERADRYGAPFSLIMFDFDHFKHVNDTFGHDVGDHVLQAGARLTTECIRGVDFAGRFGGEEFLVLLPHADLAAARHTAEKIRRAIARHRFVGAGSVTASFGVAEYLSPEDSNSLLKRADQALYRAKAGGRDRVEVAPEPCSGPADGGGLVPIGRLKPGFSR